MKVMAYYALHYGREYLKWSIRSVLPYVDEVHIFYTPYPSFGYWTEEFSPENKFDIAFTIADLLAENGNVFWHEYDRKGGTEGLHRDHCIKYLANRGADVILPVDFDEIYTPKVIEHLLEVMSAKYSRIYRVNMMHFWRSFHYVCFDPAYPVRGINLDVSASTEETYINENYKCWHFGYAQSPKVVRYKSLIHGHRSEWRDNWFVLKFLNWKEDDDDVHPTNVDFWSPVLFYFMRDPDFVDLLYDHPYYKWCLRGNLINDKALQIWNYL